MQTVVFYFSGTGNSLHITKRIAEKLNGVEIRSMVSLMSFSSTQKVSATAVGFVFPVYFYTMPEIVKEAIKKCEFTDDTYFFAVATNGGDAGNALYEMDKILEERNSRLHYGIEVPLGDNSLAIRTPDDKIKQRLENSDKMLDSLVQAVKMRDVTKANAVFRKKAISTFHGKTIRLVMRYYYRFEDRKIDRAVCSNCGLCHRICPVNNIHYEEGEVRIGENCAECFACINYCPNQAIRFGRLHPRIDTQYRFPKVTAMDIIGQKSGS